MYVRGYLQGSENGRVVTIDFFALVSKKHYKEALQDINIEEYLKNPLTCDFSHSPFQYNPSGHVITGDLHIIQHESLRKVISQGKESCSEIFDDFPNVFFTYSF